MDPTVILLFFLSTLSWYWTGKSKYVIPLLLNHHLVILVMWGRYNLMIFIGTGSHMIPCRVAHIFFQVLLKASFTSLSDDGNPTSGVGVNKGQSHASVNPTACPVALQNWRVFFKDQTSYLKTMTESPACSGNKSSLSKIAVLGV